MKKLDYLVSKDRVENPYYYWIKEHECEPEENRISSEKFDDEWWVFAQKPGALAENALLFIRAYLAKQDEKLNIDYIYTDEDVITDSAAKDRDRDRREPWLKPEWSPDTLDSFFYIGGLSVIKKELALRVSTETGFELGLIPITDGVRWVDTDSFDFLRDCAHKARRVSHISRILYHSLGKKSYEYITPRYVGEVTGKISVVILSKDNPQLLEQCLQAVSIGGKGLSVETIVVDNGSSPENRAVIEEMSKNTGFFYDYHPMEFRYSTLCNIGAKRASGDFLLFLNDDIEQIGPIRFMARMMWEAAKPHVGAVGIKLLYPGGDKIQHVGVTDLAVGPSHKLATYPDAVDYDHGRNHKTYNMLAVTGACLMVEKKKFDEVSGFDERLAVSYTDVDLCVDLFQRGYYNLVINECFLYHHESISRGNDIVDETKMERLRAERKFFYEKHPFLQESGDPFYHKDLTKTKLSYEPEFQQEWEKTDILQEPENMDSRPVSTDREQFRANIDAIRFVPGLEKSDISYVEIEGWCFYGKKDNLKYDKSLIFVDKQGKEPGVCCKVVNKYREDLLKVFPDEKNILFAGFICRLPFEQYEKYEGRTLAVALTKTEGFGSGKCIFKETTWQIKSRKA